MTLKKDKAKVLGERFDDERIKTFLYVTPPKGLNPDFCALERAYRGMVSENFATFVKFFVEAGLDINATNEQNQTLLSIVSQHAQSQEYTDALRANGAI